MTPLRFPPRRILVAIDESPGSYAAWDQAVVWARRFDANLCAVHALAVPGIALAPVYLHERNGSAWRMEVFERIRERIGPGPGLFVLEGLPGEVIVGMAGNLGVDLIMMGTRGRSRTARIMLGSVAEAVGAQAPVPVLALHRPEHIDGILAPVNFKPHSLDALKYAAWLAAAFQVRLRILTVADAASKEGLTARMLDALAGLPASVRQACRPTCVIESGPPAERIAAVVEPGEVIVLSAHQKPLMREQILGSTAQRVLGLTEAAVLTLPCVETPAAVR